MKEEKRTYHKRRKWLCPKCGYVRFQKLKKQAANPGFVIVKSPKA